MTIGKKSFTLGERLLLGSPGREPVLPVLPRVDRGDVFSVMVVVVVRGDQDVSNYLQSQLGPLGLQR